MKKKTTANSVIIIEDNETFSLLVTHYLKNNLENAKVFTEHSGARAMDSIQRLKPSLVVLDYYLEDDLSAKDVMHVINQMGEDRPRVILFSSIKDEAEKNEVMAMGIDLFVPKSNESFYDLVVAIESLLQEEREASEKFDGKKPMLIRSALIGLFLLVLLIVLILILSFL